MLGGIKFIGVNFYSSVPEHTYLEEMKASATKFGLDQYIYPTKGNQLTLVDHTGCSYDNNVSPLPWFDSDFRSKAIDELFAPVNGCESNTAQSTCDSNADCTWCKSAAVKSACYSLADAATLPASIFACDAKNEQFLQ